MIGQLVGTGFGLLDAWGQNKKEKDAAKQVNKSIDRTVNELKNQKNQLGIDSEQAQGWAQRQMARVANSAQDLDRYADMYGRKIETNAQRETQYNSAIADAESKRVSVPKFNWFAEAPKAVATGIAFDEATGGALDSWAKGLFSKTSKQLSLPDPAKRFAFPALNQGVNAFWRKQ